MSKRSKSAGKEGGKVRLESRYSPLSTDGRRNGDSGPFNQITPRIGKVTGSNKGKCETRIRRKYGENRRETGEIEESAAERKKRREKQRKIEKSEDVKDVGDKSRGKKAKTKAKLNKKLRGIKEYEDIKGKLTKTEEIDKW